MAVAGDLRSGHEWRSLAARRLLLLVLAAMEVGLRPGRRQSARLPAGAENRVGVPTTGMLCLPAFTLGTDTSIADKRFEARCSPVAAEANAIGTAWLRADLLREAKEAAAMRGLLADHARIRLDCTAVDADGCRILTLSRARAEVQEAALGAGRGGGAAPRIRTPPASAPD